MSNQMDELDMKIVQLLQTNARASVTELAKKSKSSRPTIVKRIKRLLDEKLIVIRSGLNLRQFGFKVAHVGLEVETEKTRKEIENFLRSCPRVLDIFKTPEKANIHLTVWGEDDQTISSTIESFRDKQNVSIVYTHYLGTPIQGDITIDVELKKDDKTPCGKKCSECHSFQNEWCRGCPSSSDYKTSF